MLIFRCGDFLGDAGDFRHRLLGKPGRQSIRADDGEDVHAGRVGFAEHFDDLAFGVDVARGPFGQFDDDLVADLGVARGLGVHVVRHARVVGNDVVDVAALLQGADNRVAGPLQNANHLAGWFVDRLELPAIAVEADDDLVVVQGHRGVFARDVHVGARLGLRPGIRADFRPHECKAVRVKLDRSHDQVGILGKNEAVGADTDDLALFQHFGEHAAEIAPFGRVQAEFGGQFIAAERMVIGCGEKRLDFLADVH